MAIYAIIKDGVVDNRAISDMPLAPNWVEVDDSVQIGYLWDGQTFTPPPPPQKTPEELQKDIVTKTQQRLDDFARTRGYDDIKSASDYAGCSVTKFSIEGTYCRDSRAETWAKLYDILAEVQAGTRPVPSGYADIEADLPVLTWP